MRSIRKPEIAAPDQLIDMRNPNAVMEALAALVTTESAKVATTVNAGKNREFNAPAAVSIVTELRNLMGEHVFPELFIRVDDEELWPDKIRSLRAMTLQQRIVALRDVSRGQVMDAMPYLREIEDSIPLQANAKLTPLLQPQCTSFVEQYWAVLPPDSSLSLGDDTTHIITPVSCTSLQRRMALASQDAIAAGGFSANLEKLALLRHMNINESDEWKSLMAARLLRTVLGKRTYVDMCTGQGRIGRLYKGVQDWKIRRAEQHSVE